jgi:hypothetical protein
MSNQGDNKSLGEVFKTVIDWITVLIGLINTLVGFVNLARGNTGLLTVVLLGVGIGSLLLSCGFVYFKQVTIGRDLGVPTKRYAYPKLARRLALVGLFAIPILIALSYWGWSVYLSRQVIVLVANFQGQPTQLATVSDELRVTQTIKYQLDAATEEFRDVRIQRLGETIDDRDVARVKGKQYKAKLVLWGWYSMRAKYFSIHFEVLRRSSAVSLPIRPNEPFDVAEPQYFEILLRQLPKEMSYVTLLAIRHLQKSEKWAG